MTSQSSQSDCCRNCCFFQPNNDFFFGNLVMYPIGRILQQGECRRHAPRSYPKWPKVHELNWCGEYKPAESKESAERN